MGSNRGGDYRPDPGLYLHPWAPKAQSHPTVFSAQAQRWGACLRVPQRGSNGQLFLRHKDSCDGHTWRSPGCLGCLLLFVGGCCLARISHTGFDKLWWGDRKPTTGFVADLNKGADSGYFSLLFYNILRSFTETT